MANPILRFVETFSGHWAMNLETKVPRIELYEKRIASSKPSLGFFVLLVCSAVIATLGLISNSTAVVIGAMIVAPLMDPILSLAFGLAVSDGKLIRRSAVTVTFGVAAVVGTASLLSLMLGISNVQSEIIGRTSPNLIDLGIAVAAAVAGSFSMTRERLSNSIAGVAIAVALVPPLCGQRDRADAGLGHDRCVWSRHCGRFDQSDRRGFLSSVPRQPDRHRRGQLVGLSGSALWLREPLLAQSGCVDRFAWVALHPSGIVTSRLQRSAIPGS